VEDAWREAGAQRSHCHGGERLRCSGERVGKTVMAGGGFGTGWISAQGSSDVGRGPSSVTPAAWWVKECIICLRRTSSAPSLLFGYRNRSQ
jgi:hypothetical protein